MGKQRKFSSRRQQPIPPNLDTSTLHGTVIKKWCENGVFFNPVSALEWVNIGPDSEDTQDILRWAQDHPYLKVTSTLIPHGIMPLGREGYLYDIVVKPPRARGPRVLDDDVYDAFPHLRTFVPRGMTILETRASYELSSSSGDDADAADSYQIVIYATKKFTGGPGDDDDASKFTSNLPIATSRWEHYFIEPVSNTSYFFDTSKENGDAAHLGIVNISGERLLICGSKNVHLMVKNRTDVTKYMETRYQVARSVALALLDFFECTNTKLKGSSGSSSNAMDQFFQYMLDNKLTATFEFLEVDHQHVELFPFNKSEFRFITFTSNTELQALCVDDLEETLQVAKNAGFTTITVQRHDYEEQDSVFQQIRHRYGKEGSVLYYCNSNGKVIGLVKKKTIWYILVRAIREKVKSLHHRMMQTGRVDDKYETNWKKKVSDSMKQKQNWLGFSDQILHHWTELGIACGKWVQDAFRRGKLNTTPVSTMFPKVWDMFLKERSLNDHIPIQSTTNP